MPQTPLLTCEAAGAGGKPYPPTPTVSVVDSKASRVKMHGYAALDPSTSVGVAKRSEADGAGNLSRLAKQPLAAWPLQVGGDPTLRGKGAGGFPLHPCHVANVGGVGQRPTVLTSPLGARSRGNVPKALI